MGKKNKKVVTEETKTTTTTTTSDEDNSVSDQFTDSNTNSSSSVNNNETLINNDDGGEFNPFKNLTEKQIETFKSFKERVWSMEMTDLEKKWVDCDMLLLRYLRARDYELEASFALLKGTLEWRKQFKPEEISAEDLSYEASTGKQYVFGKSMGRSVIYLRPVRENTKDHDKQIKLLVYNIERAISLMDKSKGHEQIVLLIDFKNYSIRNSPPMSVAKQTLKILSDCYPERLGNAFLIETPFVFNIFWTAISPFLNKVTSKKVIFANGDKQREKVFSKYFNLEELEAEFGGKDDSNTTYNHHEFWKKEIIQSRKERSLDPLSDDELLNYLNATE